MPKVYHDVIYRALRLHGALGLSNEMPFSAQMVESFMPSLADGPTEVHKVTVARRVLREYKANPDLFPSGHLISLREKAIKKYGKLLEREVGNLYEGRGRPAGRLSTLILSSRFVRHPQVRLHP